MKNKIYSWTLVIAWMALIFYLSHQPATQSNGLSTGITERIIVMFEKLAPNMEFDIRSFNHIVRKNAHFFAYLILGLLTSNALKNSNVEDRKGFLLAFLISVSYAASDEFHQLFVPGRGGQVKDVFIDSMGSLVGITLYYKTKLFNRIKL